MRTVLFLMWQYRPSVRFPATHSMQDPYKAFVKSTRREGFEPSVAYAMNLARSHVSRDYLGEMLPGPSLATSSKRGNWKWRERIQ